MGRLRGKRNRDQDRYWTIQRRAEQSGMVGAVDVPVCCFCGALTPSDEAIWTQGDIVCLVCGKQRGMYVKPHNAFAASDEGRQALIACGFITNDFNSRDSRSHKLRGTLCAEVQYNSGLDPVASVRAHERVFKRACLWLSRDSTVELSNVVAEASSVLEMELDEARAVVRDLRQVVYRQQYPRRQSEVPRKFSHAQIEQIRIVYAKRLRSQARLAVEYGTTQATINAIVTGSIYKGAAGPIHIPRRDYFLPSPSLFARLERNRAFDDLARGGLVGVSASGGLRTDLGSTAANDWRLVGSVDEWTGRARISVDCPVFGASNVACGVDVADGSDMGESQARDVAVPNSSESTSNATKRGRGRPRKYASEGNVRRSPSRDPEHRAELRRLESEGVDLVVCHDKQGKAYVKAVGTPSPQSSGESA
jgi:hypothetical protein